MKTKRTNWRLKTDESWNLKEKTPCFSSFVDSFTKTIFLSNIFYLGIEYRWICSSFHFSIQLLNICFNLRFLTSDKMYHRIRFSITESEKPCSWYYFLDMTNLYIHIYIHIYIYIPANIMILSIYLLMQNILGIHLNSTSTVSTNPFNFSWSLKL